VPKILSIKRQEELREGIKRYLSTHEEARFVRRLDLLLLLSSGQSISNVSRVFGVSPVTVQRCVYRFNAEGIDGLRDRPKKGRPKRLTDLDKDRLKRELSSSPVSLGYKQGHWDGKLLSFHLMRKYNVNFKVRRCQLLFHELGLSLQRPRRIPVGGDPELRETFKKNSKKRS
jgi:transposase